MEWQQITSKTGAQASVAAFFVIGCYTQEKELAGSRCSDEKLSIKLNL